MTARTTTASRTTTQRKPKRRVEVRRVDECGTLDELFRSCLPAFGGAYLRRVYTLLDQAIGAGCPLTLAIAGPVTVSGQHQTWLIPLLETGWVAYLSTTDAVCYHDGHRSLDEHPRSDLRGPDLRRRRRAARREDDPRHRHGVRRGRPLPAGPLHDRLPAAPRVPEVDDRHRAALPASAASTPRRRRRTASRRGCSRPATGWRVPILVGAPGDGSLFLNSMKLWAMQQAGLLDELRLRARPPRRGLRVVRLSLLGAVHASRALARHPDPGRRRAEELQPAAGAGARPGAGARRDPRLHLRRPDRQRAGDRRARSPPARRPRR